MRLLINAVAVSSALVACFIASEFEAHAQSIGALYGARDPHACVDSSKPQTGPIPPEIATRYVLGVTEGLSIDLLYFSSDVVVQVGKGRPFIRESDGGLFDIDVEQLVYPIRGSCRRYQCDKWKDAGSNCTIYDQPNASGMCYRTVFADWRCNMADSAATVVHTGAPPPQ